MNAAYECKHYTDTDFNISVEKWTNSNNVPPVPPPVLMNFAVFPPGCGDSVADFWGWGAHEAQLRCPDDVSGDMYIYEDEVPGCVIKSKSTSYPDHSHWETSPTRKHSHGRAGIFFGIEPGTSWLEVRNLDH